MLMKALRIGLGQVIVAGDLLTRPPRRKRTAEARYGASGVPPEGS